MNAVLAEAVTAELDDSYPYKDGIYDGKWSIWDPREVKYVERTDFLKSLCGHIDNEDPLEKIVLSTKKRGVTATELKGLADTYTKLKNKGARLPKFSKWVLGMWVGHKDYQQMLAEEGQRAAKRKIIMSVDVIDILRSAATQHFHSCFRKPTKDVESYYGDYMERLPRNEDGRIDAEHYPAMPAKIAEECPGIGIVYVEDEKGNIMGRQWMHHAKLKSTGEDIVVLTEGYYGCLEPENLARLIAQKFKVKVAFNGAGRDNPIEYVGCFTESLHHDLYTWQDNPTARIINPEI